MSTWTHAGIQSRFLKESLCCHPERSEGSAFRERAKITTVCGMISASCSVRSRCVRKICARARELHSTGPTCSCSRACAPNLPRRPAIAHLLPGCAALRRQQVRSLPRGFRFQEARPCSRAASRSLRLLRNPQDRKSTRLNSSHQIISYAVFCLKKKKRYSHKRVAPDVRTPLGFSLISC